MLEINSPLRRTKKKLVLIQKIALFLSKTQGRDKLCKLLQYIFRFLAACFQMDSYKNTKYTSLTESTRDARKIFRLFKSVNEYEEMTYILFNEDENLMNLLKLLSSACYFFYWGFDNVSILSKIKLFRLNFRKLYKIGASFWFFALTFMNASLILQLFFFKESLRTILQLKENPSQIPQNCPLLPDFQIRKYNQLVEISDEEKKRIRKHKWLLLIKNTFDLVPSGKQSQILQIVFNRVIPQKIAGLCGFASALISIYQVIKQINQNN